MGAGSELGDDMVALTFVDEGSGFPLLMGSSLGTDQSGNQSEPHSPIRVELFATTIADTGCLRFLLVITR